MVFSRRQFLSVGAAALSPPLPSTDEEIIHFLLNAKIVKEKFLGSGVTNSRRLTLTLDGLTHDAHWQIIDEARMEFRGERASEMNFRDSWKFNVAAYGLDRLLSLYMIPVSVARRHGGNEGAITWWLDGTITEEARQKKKLECPDSRFACQMHIVKAFDELIYNMDRNMGNLLITPSWKVWMIDHTRAFRLHPTLKEPGKLVRCDRFFRKQLASLTRPALDAALLPWLRSVEIKPILDRRDKILARFDQLCRRLGEEKVLFDYLIAS